MPPTPTPRTRAFPLSDDWEGWADEVDELSAELQAWATREGSARIREIEPALGRLSGFIRSARATTLAQRELIRRSVVAVAQSKRPTSRAPASPKRVVHTCHAHGCEKPCPPEKLMCRACWALVPHELQRAVHTTYRPGQCDDKQPSAEWRRAAHAAIRAVAVAQGLDAAEDGIFITPVPPGWRRVGIGEADLPGGEVSGAPTSTARGHAMKPTVLVIGCKDEDAARLARAVAAVRARIPPDFDVACPDDEQWMMWRAHVGGWDRITQWAAEQDLYVAVVVLERRDGTVGKAVGDMALAFQARQKSVGVLRGDGQGGGRIITFRTARQIGGDGQYACYYQMRSIEDGN